jgi:ABC-2 type transport system ATP-binding protein
VREVRDAGRTIFMSSHILAEVEEAADRVAILREGRLVAVERMQSLRERAGRPTEIRFAAPVQLEEFTDLPGIRDLTVEGTVLTCVVEGSADALIKRASRFTVETVLSRPPDLEDVFMAYYGPQGGESDVA